jgi:hypothetical protein
VAGKPKAAGKRKTAAKGKAASQRLSDAHSALWALHVPLHTVPRIIKRLDALTGGQRGLASLRVVPDAEGIVELTWQSPAGYKSLFSWCRSNMPVGMKWSLECLGGTKQAFNIHDPGALNSRIRANGRTC